MEVQWASGGAGRGLREQAGGGGVHVPGGEEPADLRAGPGWPLGPPGVPGAEWEGLWEEAELSPRVLSKSAQPAIIKYHGPGGLNSRNLFFPSSGGQKSKIKVPAVMVSPEASLLGSCVAPPCCVCACS